MKDNSQTLSCVMIPVSRRQLILPNVSIAEVVDYASTDSGIGAPDWLAGQLEWRGLNLPVISYDAANGGTLSVPGENRGRIVVLNTISANKKLRFMALITQGIPSQVRITEDQLKQVDGENGPADIMQVDVDGEIAWIPDLDYLESLASEALA
ncbi:MULTISPECIES: chemotaxis protein CheW [unclassified Marinobacter]|uniref:chemotaxis protein CheW n=1 Tax=unclassified Marinobacter TaxID=83889 RepID=UPI0026E32560|nr:MULTISPECIES: chemotaxis protein CheW [unclassified Marinobacter]MDO6441603.1 chemotaxis protein CheW [Marinobacter sp. 2_MG-2023]MDO6822235.1 chemotaxis protein CheW [Marinobacter sp. 1_MG-2023]